VTCGATPARAAARGSVPFTLGLAVLPVLAVLALAPEARTHDTPAAWPYRTLIVRITGQSVTSLGPRIRVDRDLVICSGDGTPIRRRGVRLWKHFTCTQTLFDRSGLDRDITFRVHVLGRTRFLITNARYGPH
jgi:hypothetical protein